MDMTTAYDAQTAVLGCILLEPDKLAGEIFQRVSADDFSDASKRVLFAAAKAIWTAKRPLDPVTLVELAGAAYSGIVHDILCQTPTCASWETYCDLLRDGAALRRMQEIALRIVESHDIAEAKELSSQLGEASMSRTRFRITTYGDMISHFIDRQQDKKPPDYLDWGIPQLNDKLTISPGRFVVLAADSSVGKTAFALQLAYSVAGSGKRVGFFSYETSEADAADRLMANAADIKLPSIKHKRLGFEDIQRSVAEGMRSGELELELIEAAGATVDDIRSIVLMRRYDVIFIDYVQLIPATGEHRWQQVADNSMALHTMCQQLGVTVVGLSQVTPTKTQSGAKKELDKDNLRESRQLIMDAEAILIMELSDPKDYGSNRVLKIDKNKDGPCGRMLLAFDPRHMRFSYVPPYESDDDRRSRERYEVMDRNAQMRRDKAAEAEAKRAGDPSQIRFEELPDEGDIPFGGDGHD